MAIKLFRATREPEQFKISLKDMLEISSDDRFRVSRTPFGRGITKDEELIYAGRAVPWKGKKIKLVDENGNLIYKDEATFVNKATELGIKEEVARAIYKLAKESHELRGKAKGYVMVIRNGEPTVMPIVGFLKMVKKLQLEGKLDLLKSMDIIPLSKKRLPHVKMEEYEAKNIEDVIREVAGEVKRVREVLGKQAQELIAQTA